MWNWTTRPLSRILPMVIQALMQTPLVPGTRTCRCGRCGWCGHWHQGSAHPWCDAEVIMTGFTSSGAVMAHGGSPASSTPAAGHPCLAGCAALWLARAASGLRGGVEVLADGLGDLVIGPEVTLAVD